MRPYSFHLFVCVCAATFPAFCQDKSLIELRGIVNFQQRKIALITQNRRTFQFGENERDGRLQVLSIDSVLASARVRLDSTNDIEVRLNKPANTPPANLMLDKPDLSDVIHIYAIASGRTVLHGAAMPNAQITLYTNATSKSEVAFSLQNALLENGITIIPKGEHFAVVIPTSSAAQLKLPDAPPPGTVAEVKSADEIPAGVINFKNVDIDQAAMILAQLKGQKLDRESVRRAPTALISLETVTPLSKAEAIYAIEATFLLNGIRVVETGADSFKVEAAGR